MGLQRKILQQFFQRIGDQQPSLEDVQFVAPYQMGFRRLEFAFAVQIRRHRRPGGNRFTDGGQRPGVVLNRRGGTHPRERREGGGAFVGGKPFKSGGADVAIGLLQKLQRPFAGNVHFSLAQFAFLVDFAEESGIDDPNRAVVTLAKPVHPTETLRHALVGGHVTDQIVGGDVDAHFTRAGGDQPDGSFIPSVLFSTR